VRTKAPVAASQSFNVSSPPLPDSTRRPITDPKMYTDHKWRRALERTGIVFIEENEEGGVGVRDRDQGWILPHKPARKLRGRSHRRRLPFSRVGGVLRLFAGP
jgi:hypothetical protein